MKPNKIDQPPGTLVYTGGYKNEKIVIDVYAYNEKLWTHKVYDCINDIENDESIQWINITGLNDSKVLKDIGEKFTIDKYVLEDIIQVSRHSKIETFNNYIFAIYKMLYLKGKEVVHEHVSIIKSDTTLITFQETKGDVFDNVRNRIENNIGLIRKRKVDYLYYSLIDSLVDQYTRIIPYIDNKLDILEYQIIEGNDTTLELLYKIRKELLIIKSSVFPIKKIINGHTKRENDFIEEETCRCFEDVLDNLNQIAEDVMLHREIISGLFDTHMSNISNKMNRVMTTLALFSAIFIPLSFLAGFFGMNFINFPGLNSDYGVYIFTVICVIVGGGMFAFFKNKKML